MPRIETYTDGVLVAVVDDRTLDDAKAERRALMLSCHEQEPDTARLSVALSAIDAAGDIDAVDTVNW